MSGLGSSSAAAAATAASLGFTPAELAQLASLRATDRRVHAHEQAHMAAGGRYVRGNAHYQRVTGPDGRRYAVAGEVSIDTSPVNGDPEATIQKMLTVIAAAHAPADPSAQDRQVATQAAAALLAARQELAQQAYAAAAEAEPAGTASGSAVDLKG